MRELEENSDKRRTHSRNDLILNMVKKKKDHSVMQRFLIIQLKNFTYKVITFKTPL